MARRNNEQTFVLFPIMQIAGTAAKAKSGRASAPLIGGELLFSH